MSDVKKVEAARDKLLATARTVIVTTALPEEEGGGPDLGFSPFYRDDEGHFYIYTSHLAAHVRALLKGAPVKFMLAADESVSQNIWARVRVSFTADVTQIKRDDDRFEPMMDTMQDHLGATMGLIRQFGDFHLFRIIPEQGVLVTGFAAAYSVSGPQFTITKHLSNS
ncbi:MAG: pyridoxamine 5'-phosphate oxidase family protein [Candidatus Puniceispirillales bacterium]